MPYSQASLNSFRCFNTRLPITTTHCFISSASSILLCFQASIPISNLLPHSQVSPPGRECIGKFFNKFYVHLLTWHARTTTETTSSLRVASFSFTSTLFLSWSTMKSCSVYVVPLSISISDKVLEQTPTSQIET